MNDAQIISDFIAKNGVTKVPTGVSGLPQYKWFERPMNRGGGLREVGADGEPIGAAEFKDRMRRARQSSVAIAKRRSKVARLSKAHTVREIQDLTGISEHTIRNDLLTMGISAKRDCTARDATRARRMETRQRILEAMAQGHETGAQISRATGVPNQTVYRHLKAIHAARKEAGQ